MMMMDNDPHDNRILCKNCRRYLRNGRCQAAIDKEIDGGRSYMPVATIPRRCAGYRVKR